MAMAAVASCSSVQSLRRKPALSSSARKPSLTAALRSKGAVSNGSRVTCWFNLNKLRQDSQSSGIYGSQTRDEFDKDDVEHYFNYMGMLATEGTYDKLEALLSTGIHPVDLLLLMSSSEGDLPKIEELLNAGADASVKDTEGKTALDRAANDQVRELLNKHADKAKAV
eukprot:jgi/Chlat1/2974/Chrsp2S04702